MVHAESGNVGVVNKLLDSHAFMDAQDMVRIACLPASNVSVATSFTNCVYTSITLHAAWTNSSDEVIIQGQTGSGTGDGQKRGSY